MEIEASAFPKTPYPRELFLKWWKAMPENFYVYDEDGEVLGYIMFFPDGHVASLAVKKEQRRQGIGTALMGRVLGVCRGSCWVEVRMSNEGAKVFYEALGLELVDVEEGYYGEEDAYILAASRDKHQWT